jgi:prophage tail gpP-like protein
MIDRPAQDKIELRVSGQLHSGWTDANVEIGIDSIASGFDLTLTEKWPSNRERFALEQMSIEAGAAAQILIGGEGLINGYIDRVAPSLSGENHTIQIAGRSKAADLIDCSAIHTPGSWNGRRLEDIAADLIKPFGLSVSVQTPTGEAFKKFALQPGETVFAAIERMCKMRGLLTISGNDGNIIIMRPAISGAVVRLEQGRDFTDISAEHDVSQRFSDYILKGQSAGDDNHNGRAVSQVKGEAKDPAVKRNRPLLIVAEDQGGGASMAERSRWEAKVRAAQSQKCDITMPGFRDPSGNLWREGGSVDLYAPAAFITDKMIIARVNYQIGGSSSSTTLSLAYPDAYAELPQAEAKVSKIERKRV